MRSAQAAECAHPARAKLVFVEGMTGAGKSTTARHIETRLTELCLPVRRYHEMDDDNPIRTKGVDAMRFRHPTVRPLPDVGEDGFARDPSVYSLEQWDALARRAVGEPATLVLESRYLQNTLQPRYLAGAPAARVREGFLALTPRLRPARPLFVYLRPTDVRAHLERTMRARDPSWAAWLVASFEQSGFATSRHLTGDTALYIFYEAWEEITAELFDLHDGPKLCLSDPADDWPKSVERICAAVLG
jgi:hypothetical protein